MLKMLKNQYFIYLREFKLENRKNISCIFKHLLKCILNMFMLIIGIYKLDILKFILWLLFIFVKEKCKDQSLFTLPCQHLATKHKKVEK
jgi:hypothetical protein